MEEISIVALPEIREMIWNHLDAYPRKEAVLVCPAFYEIICRLKPIESLKLNNGVSY